MTPVVKVTYMERQERELEHRPNTRQPVRAPTVHAPPGSTFIRCVLIDTVRPVFPMQVDIDNKFKKQSNNPSPS